MSIWDIVIWRQGGESIKSSVYCISGAVGNWTNIHWHIWTGD